MSTPNAKAVINAMIMRNTSPLKRIDMPKLLEDFGKAIVAAEQAWAWDWRRTHCAVCGGPVTPADMHSQHFNIVCGAHQEFGVFFQLDLELSQRGMAPAVRCPDFWK